MGALVTGTCGWEVWTLNGRYGLIRMTNRFAHDGPTRMVPGLR